MWRRRRWSGVIVELWRLTRTTQQANQKVEEVAGVVLMLLIRVVEYETIPIPDRQPPLSLC